MLDKVLLFLERLVALFAAFKAGEINQKSKEAEKVLEISAEAKSEKNKLRTLTDEELWNIIDGK